MRTRQGKSKWRRWSRRIALAAAVSMLVALVAAWLAFQHIPSWYNPPKITSDDLPRIRASLPNTYQAFTDLLVAGEVFEFTLSAITVNEWIAARAELWPDAQDWVPTNIAEPVVAFDDDALILAGRFERGNFQGILSIRLVISIGSDDLVARVAGVGVGSLGIPKDALIDILDDYLAQWKIDEAVLSETVAGLGRPLVRTKSVRPYFEGVNIANRIRWSNGDREFRLLSVRAQDGLLTLQIEPL